MKHSGPTWGEMQAWKDRRRRLGLSQEVRTDPRPWPSELPLAKRCKPLPSRICADCGRKTARIYDGQWWCRRCWQERSPDELAALLAEIRGEGA